MNSDIYGANMNIMSTWANRVRENGPSLFGRRCVIAYSTKQLQYLSVATMLKVQAYEMCMYIHVCGAIKEQAM